MHVYVLIRQAQTSLLHKRRFYYYTKEGFIIIQKKVSLLHKKGFIVTQKNLLNLSHKN